MDGGGVRKNRLDVSEIPAQSDGARPFASTVPAKLNETLTIDFRNFAASEADLQKTKASRFRSPDRLSDFVKVRNVKANEIAERFGVASGLPCRRLAAVDPTFDVERPFFNAAATLRRICTLKEPDLSFVNVAISCALRVH